jgi:hypothetical protein
LFTALAFSLLLSGCLLTRLFTFKQQFCDYKSNFSFVTGESFRVSLVNPVLLDTDLIWLAGAAPTETEERPDSRRLQWTVDKVLPEGGVFKPEFDELAVDTRFMLEDGDYRLSEVVMDQRFSYVVSPHLMDRHAENVCHSSWLVLGKSGEIDLSDADLSGQPHRQEIIDHLGQPTGVTDDGTGLRYEYRLRGSTREGKQYSFEFWHDPDSGELLRSSTSSIRFISTTDFVKKKMMIKIKS